MGVIIYISDIFLLCPDDLLVNLNECKSLVVDLLNQLPTLFENNMETRSALGAALQAAFKMTVSLYNIVYLPYSGLKDSFHCKFGL